MEGLFGDNIRDAIKSIKREPEGKTYRVKFPMCYHPQLIPTKWNQPEPEPVRTIGRCPIHDYVCPVCGYGAGGWPACECSEMR